MEHPADVTELRAMGETPVPRTHICWPEVLGVKRNTEKRSKNFSFKDKKVVSSS